MLTMRAQGEMRKNITDKGNVEEITKWIFKALLITLEIFIHCMSSMKRKEVRNQKKKKKNNVSLYSL